jgi:tRNA pseudouridine55 synthase
MVVFGFLNVSKPLGVTSHDVVAQARRRLSVKKVGHAGTLDPMATGVLILCLGNATRLSEYVMDSTKRYRAGLRLGVVTDTYDSEGAMISERDSSHIQREDVERLLPAFTGDIEQVPPMYSAIKQQGRKLYELAREGRTVEREARQVTILSLELVDWSPPLVTLDVTCSAGTYIRSLAYDLGQALGVGASLASLARTASGSFTIGDALSPDGLFEDPEWQRFIVPPARALAAYPSVTLTGSAVNDIYNGRPTPKPEAIAVGTLAMGYDLGGQLLAVLLAAEGWWKPQKVFYP